jgi:putative PIN family toxin of toxin-antitoxin system
MIRAVLDSSVLVSAFLTARGTSAEVLRKAGHGRFALCLSEEIIGESTRSLRLKTQRIRRYYPEYTDDQIDRFAELLHAAAELYGELPAIRAVAPDPTDDVIVATAVKAAADFIVTGDRHLLALGAHRGIQIVTPRQFLDLLR